MTANDTKSWGTSPPSAGDFEIPPAIACAHCGSTICDGCAPVGPAVASSAYDSSRRLLWEKGNKGVLDRLLTTAEFTALEPTSAFGFLKRGSIVRALSFAVLCELLAVTSFTLAWGLGFYLAFPFVARQMLTSPPVLALILMLLFALITFVILVHVLWGTGLEWGIARTGGHADLNLGIRFGLYACGWDLLTSPAGFAFAWQRHGFRLALSHVRAGTKAPRPSLKAYLEECRELSSPRRKSATWTAIWLGIAGVVMSGVMLFFVLLLAFFP